MNPEDTKSVASDKWVGMCMPLFTAQEAVIVAAHLRHIHLLGHTEGSIYSRARALHRMALFIAGPLIEATAADLMAWRQSLTITDEAVVHYVSHAREFYRWCVREGYRADDPTLNVPVPKMARRLPRPVSDEDLAYAVAAADGRIRPWLILAAWCGLRAKEIALLRWECVLDTAVPPVLLVAADATKGRKERAIPLHEFAAAELAVLPGRRAGYVFPRHDGRPGPNKPWIVSQLANKHLHACGSPSTIHQLRHWFGTNTYRSKRDLRVVQELLGHSSPSTTAGYAAYDRAEATEAVNALPVPSALRPVRDRKRSGLVTAIARHGAARYRGRTNTPRPGTEYTRPSSFSTFTARWMVFSARPVSAAMAVSEGSLDVISPASIRSRSMAATCMYGCSGDSGLMITRSKLADHELARLRKVTLAIPSHSRTLNTHRPMRGDRERGG